MTSEAKVAARAVRAAAPARIWWSGHDVDAQPALAGAKAPGVGLVSVQRCGGEKVGAGGGRSQGKGLKEALQSLVLQPTNQSTGSVDAPAYS